MNNSKYIVDPNGERRAGCFGNAIRYGVGLPLLGFLLWLLFSMCGCASTKCIPETVEVHDTVIHTDSVTIERVRDSIVYRDRQDSTYTYIKDSTSEKQRGDTVYITKWHTHYEYKASSETAKESVNAQTSDKQKTSDKHTKTEKEVIVKTERYIPKFYKFTMWLFWIVVVVLVVWFVWWLADYIPVLKPYKQSIKTFLKIVH